MSNYQDRLEGTVIAYAQCIEGMVAVYASDDMDTFKGFFRIPDHEIEGIHNQSLGRLKGLFSGYTLDESYFDHSLKYMCRLSVSSDDEIYTYDADKRPVTGLFETLSLGEIVVFNELMKYNTQLVNQKVGNLSNITLDDFSGKLVKSYVREHFINPMMTHSSSPDYAVLSRQLKKFFSISPDFDEDIKSIIHVIGSGMNNRKEIVDLYLDAIEAVREEDYEKARENKNMIVAMTAPKLEGHLLIADTSIYH